MEDIANDIVDQALSDFAEELLKRIEEQQRAIYQQAIEDFLQVLEYDAESVVNVGINGCEEIFIDLIHCLHIEIFSAPAFKKSKRLFITAHRFLA